MDLHGGLEAWRTLRRLVSTHRRFVVAALLAVAVFATLRSLHPSAPPTRAVWVAARDLPGGQPLTAAELRTERVPRTLVPHDALLGDRSIVGRLLAAPVRAGEPLTDVRLLTPSMVAAGGNGDDVAVPVRVADGPAALSIVQAGDLIDVIAATDPDDPGPGAEPTVVRDVRVLSVPGQEVPDQEPGSDDTAGVLIVAATTAQAQALAQAAAGERLSVAVTTPTGASP